MRELVLGVRKHLLVLEWQNFLARLELLGIVVEGIVSLAARDGPWQPSRHDDIIKSVSRLPLPARGHRACRLALSLRQSEPTRC